VPARPRPFRTVGSELLPFDLPYQLGLPADSPLCRPLAPMIKVLIWFYIVLLFFEGALRKWIFPGQADALLIARDPVLVLVYLLAMVQGKFPVNGWTVALLGMAFGSVVTSFAAGMSNFFVLAYGLRINYLHFPLIWVMAAVLNRRDVLRLGWFFLVFGIVNAGLMVLQFNAGPRDWINKGVGEGELGQLFGAEGRVRPSGFFSFITGPVFFLPLATAFFLHFLGRKGKNWHLPLTIAAGLALLVAVPVSISRFAFVMVLIVAAAFVITVLFGRRSPTAAGKIRAVFLTALVAFLLFQLPIFEEGKRVFLVRWEQAAPGQETGTQNMIQRVTGGLSASVNYITRVPFWGHGIGVGSNVGSRVLTGRVGWLLPEDEWSKIFAELGPVLGGSFVLWRCALVGWLFVGSWRRLRSTGDNLPFLLWSGCAFALFMGQLAPPTILGFTVVGGGLTLAALNHEEEDEEWEDDEEQPDDAFDEDDEAFHEDGAGDESAVAPPPPPAAPTPPRADRPRHFPPLR
jgi:hypothetical protein